MIYNYKYIKVPLTGSYMDCVKFGTGDKNLIMIPGLSLQGVKEAGASLALLYRIFAKDYTVYMFDRRRFIPQGFTAENIADDIAVGMDRLGIKSADILGVSLGGMAAQYLAIKYPGKVDKLVLALTAATTNQLIESAVGGWIKMIQAGDTKTFITDMAEKMYSEKRVRFYRGILSALSPLAMPKDRIRFINTAKAAMSCDTYPHLDKITCPCLVIAAREDKVVGAARGRDIASKIGCELFVYSELGHGAYDEAKDFNKRVLEFFNRK